jgi:hypothetical protein
VPRAVLGSQQFVRMQYRYRRNGTPLPTFDMINPGLPFPNPEALVPVHWRYTPLNQSGFSPPIFLTNFDGSDGEYTLQFSAQKAISIPDGQVTDTEPRHTARLTLDNTPPAITINQPVATQYPHSATLTLDYNVGDGAGSGVREITASLDGATTLAGHGLASGQPIDLLTELSLGTHTFIVQATDNLGNTSMSSVTFTIIVTPDSIKDEVSHFSATGAIKNKGLANSLLAKLNAAAKARARGNCKTASNIYEAFINELQAQSGNGVDAAAAAIMIQDAQYLIEHCP